MSVLPSFHAKVNMFQDHSSDVFDNLPTSFLIYHLNTGGELNENLHCLYLWNSFLDLPWIFKIRSIKIWTKVPLDRIQFQIFHTWCCIIDGLIYSFLVCYYHDYHHAILRWLRNNHYGYVKQIKISQKPIIPVFIVELLLPICTETEQTYTWKSLQFLTPRTPVQIVRVQFGFV